MSNKYAVLSLALIKFIGTPQVYDDSVKISYTSSLPTECSLDQGSYEYCTSPYQQSNLKPGTHSLVVKTTECHGQNSVHFYVSGSRSYYKAGLLTLIIPYYAVISVYILQNLKFINHLHWK